MVYWKNQERHNTCASLYELFADVNQGQWKKTKTKQQK